LRRLTWKEHQAVCELEGWVVARIKGDHLFMTREGWARPVVIKMSSDLGEDIIQNNKRTMGLTTAQFEALLDRVRRGGK
jgi:predicted RNA binding protein YcfA (HicA-like mRNA interferase family)